MLDERNFLRPWDGKRESRRLGAAIADLAARQFGVVARLQLRALGASYDQIDGWIATRRLIPIHRGVYLVGHRLRTVETGWMAGVLVGGEAALLSHRACADHWELTGLARRTADVTVPGYRRPRRGIRFHRSLIPADERTIHEGIPVTTVARTLLDLAAAESPARLRKALAVAEARLLTDSTPLVKLIERYPGKRGVARLRTELGIVAAEGGVAHGELEIRFDEFLDERDLPPPERNVPIEVGTRTFVVDCLWRGAGVVVELDSRRHHGDWEAAEADRARDLALLSIGLRTARVTWRRLQRPAELEAELRSLIERNIGRP
jgi:hypothetical protein